MRGRPLDPVDESAYIAGQTTEIFVSRMSLYDDAMEEILFEGSAPVDRSTPLEVTFTGEHAPDFGGPRKEFFPNMLRLIKEKLCIKNYALEIKRKVDMFSLIMSQHEPIGSIMEQALFLV